ncbi:hypothetical protein LTR27_011664 [Elasticomyces elasticus]|nr:hypothetical protein LTR27_011664 [Elasticomyces elasticus]
MAAFGDYTRFTLTNGVDTCHGTFEIPDRDFVEDPETSSNRGEIVIRIRRAGEPGDEEFSGPSVEVRRDIIINDRQRPHLVLTATSPRPQRERVAVRERLTNVSELSIQIAVLGVTPPNAWFLEDFHAPFWAWTLRLLNARNGQEVIILANLEMLSGDAIDIELVRVE